MMKVQQGCEIYDVSGLSRFRDMDIDFVEFLSDKEIVTYEVKTDRRICETGNIWLESCIHFTDGKSPNMVDGWMHKSKADKLVYIDADIKGKSGDYQLCDVRHIYVCDMAAVIAEATEGARYYQTRHFDRMTRNGKEGRTYEVWGFKIPIKALIDKGIAEEYV